MLRHTNGIIFIVYNLFIDSQNVNQALRKQK